MSLHDLKSCLFGTTSFETGLPHLGTPSIIISSSFLTSAQCSPLSPSLGHLCVPPAWAPNCHYDGGQGGTEESPFFVNCCCGRCDADKTCVQDSITGSGLWQPIMSPLCPTEGCGTEGDLKGFDWCLVSSILSMACCRLNDYNPPGRCVHLPKPS